MFWISVFMAMTIALPALAGAVRYNSLHHNDRLFIIITWLGFLNELASLAFILLSGSNAINYNYYILLESLLFLALFWKWNLITRKTTVFILLAVLDAIWIIDNIIFNNAGNFFGIFNVIFALVVMFFAIKCIVKQVTYHNDNIFTDARFLVATGLLLHFCIKAITDSFFIIDLQISTALARNILFISSVVNVISNLLYFIAIICFNRSQKFTLEYW